MKSEELVQFTANSEKKSQEAAKTTADKQTKDKFKDSPVAQYQ